jgi:hypothetical protein
MYSNIAPDRIGVNLCNLKDLEPADFLQKFTPEIP